VYDNRLCKRADRNEKEGSTEKEKREPFHVF